MHNKIVVSLRISAEEYQRLYRGTARAVLAHSESGLRVRFPAKVLQPFVEHQGVQGRFVISFDDLGKFQAIERIRPRD